MRLHTQKNLSVRLDAKEWIMSTAIYIVISVTVAWLFYDSIIVAFIFAPLYLLYKKAVIAVCSRRKSEQLTDGFIKSLNSVASSLAAGLSAENAFIAAGADMEKMLGYRAGIVKELNIVNSHVKTGVRVEDALFEMAKRTKITEIYDFALVFSVASKNGADCPAVISSCTQIMEAKRRAEEEARIMIRSKQYEQRVMCIILPGILAYLRLSSGSFISVLYHNPLGILIMSACLAVYILAVYLAEKIGDIRV